jgi:hypothetical protein
VAFHLFLSACSSAIISVFILFTLPFMLLLNNLKTKGSKTKCTKNWKEFRQREWEEVLSSYRVEVGGTCCFGGTCFGWQLLGASDQLETKTIESISNQKWSPRFVIDTTFVAIGQVTPPQKRTLDAPLLRIPSMNEIMCICLNPQTFPFHLVPLDLQV